jgi:hypothetical protein
VIHVQLEKKTSVATHMQLEKKNQLQPIYNSLN